MKSFNFTKEGLPLDPNDSQDVDKKVIAAMSAALLHISEQYAKEYALGNLKRTLIDTGKEILVLSKRGENGLLTIFEDKSELSEFKDV